MQTYVNNLQDSSLSKFIHYHFENNNLETVSYLKKKKMAKNNQTKKQQ